MAQISSLTISKNPQQPGEVSIITNLKFYPGELEAGANFALTIVGFDVDFKADNMIIYPNYPQAGIVGINDDYLFKFQDALQPSGPRMRLRYTGLLSRGNEMSSWTRQAMKDDSPRNNGDANVEVKVWAVLVPETSYAVKSSNVKTFQKAYEIEVPV